MARPAVEKTSAFLNIPYDKQFENLYLAYIAGLTAFGLVPRATLEIPGGTRRLDRIFELIQTCGYSFHDLSRVQLDRLKPKTPRFNMPFELGLAIGWAKSEGHNDQAWFVLEAVNRRIQKSLSDLNGTDVYVHDGNVKGVLRELSNALVRNANQPTFPQMIEVYRKLRKAVPNIMTTRGAGSALEPRVFRDLVVLAASLRKVV
ncbi:MAG: hypothetical protein L0387_03970 [Acidobacteria bacterium]|nr:hypothetical protein [Acidobacteriota bacterium]MCI0620819.1 hypothetical protein [Acidobacteriota bacterium]MCI0721018.1 hypothetical protein [Acidobacteriota bacterium]